MRIAIIGGTGPEGKGLTYRFAFAGHELMIGSRSTERAAEAAREVAAHASKAVRGAENVEAAREAELIVLTVPFSAQAGTLPALREASDGKIVVSTAVPMSFDPSTSLRAGSGKLRMLDVPEGSAAEQAQALLPDAKVAGAFQNLSAGKLWKGDDSLDQDVIVCADDAAAKRDVMALAEEIRGVRAVDGGPLAASRYVEGITVLLVGINNRYKSTTGVRIVGLP